MIPEPDRWKVRRLPNGRWYYHHPTCPSTPHLCMRAIGDLFFSRCCASKDTLEAAYAGAAQGHRSETMGRVERSILWGTS